MKSFLALLIFIQPVAANDVHRMLDAAARRHSVPVSLVHAIAHTESGFSCGARNGNFRGVMQVGRAATREVGGHWPPRSCYEEIDIGVRYLKLAVARGGAGCVGASLYNAGINSPKRCSAYGRTVMRFSKGRGAYAKNTNVFHKRKRK